ncbi:MAG: DUF2066 domain-containing protein [Methylococcales bacterium]|nr:DUF2066 domain-containing protein [Methylococcaceae bacterium]
MLYRALFLTVLLFCTSVFAAEVRGLYETEVIVRSQTVEDKHAAVKEALTVVISRILAGENVLQDKVVKSIIEDAPRFVKQQQYSLVEAASGANEDARIMRVSFNELALLEAINNSHLKVWGDIRPETLLWLVVEENGRRVFFKADSMPELNLAISKGSKLSGLPLLYPLGDLDEQRQLSVNDVLSAYPQNLLSVSDRYGVVSILAGRLVKSQDCWKADWAFYFDDRVQQWNQPCATLNEVIRSGMKGVYAQLANVYAAKPYNVEPAGVITLTIEKVAGQSDMDRVTHYLQSMPMVTSVDWLDAHAGVNRYRVNYHGDRHLFEELVGIGRVLDPRDVDSAGIGELRYRLLESR